MSISQIILFVGGGLVGSFVTVWILMVVFALGGFALRGLPYEWSDDAEREIAAREAAERESAGKERKDAKH